MRAWRWHLLILICLALLFAPANYFAARYLSRHPPIPPTSNVDLSYGPDAARLGYSVATPPDQPQWPAPTQVQIEWSLGYRLIGTWSSRDGRPGHQMRVEEYGWPLPVLVDAQYWWPWDEPEWKSKYAPDPSIRIAWPGVVLNPLIIALGLWSVIAIPLLLVLSIKRAYRQSRNACVFCGYPRGHAPQCSECGYTAAS
ncbi:MAG TPA: hypothetical protein VD997_17080 [Phycisphaerales bacterium]|nr:hypothetical protein [Phycisphaerales bacterium]